MWVPLKLALSRKAVYVVVVILFDIVVADHHSARQLIDDAIAQDVVANFFSKIGFGVVGPLEVVLERLLALKTLFILFEFGVDFFGGDGNLERFGFLRHHFVIDHTAQHALLNACFDARRQLMTLATVTGHRSVDLFLKSLSW